MKIPIVFISGLLSNASVWSHQVKNLDEWAIPTVVSPTEETPKQMVESILNRAPDRFALVGHSMGGWLCLEVMKQAKERVMKLCLMNTTAAPDSPSKKAKRLQMIERVQQGEFPLVASEMADWLVFNDLVKSDVKKMFNEVGAEAFIRQQHSMLMREECEAILLQIECPTLVVHASKDRVFSLEDHQHLVRNIPKAKLAIIEECGHMSTMEKPVQVNSLLREWLIGKK